MRKTSSSKRILAAIAVLSLTVPGAAWARGNGKKASERMFTFGDSLSDAGNHFAEIGEVSQAPFDPVPSFPYAIGGHHFSNGDTWVEQLTKRLGKPTSGHPASLSPGVFTNYAVGRARARANAPDFPLFDLGTQINIFFADFGGNAPSDAVYAIWIGSNDTRDALSALGADPSGATSLGILNDAVMSIGNNITALYLAGARDFLILNVPNLAITPAVQSSGRSEPCHSDRGRAVLGRVQHRTRRHARLPGRVVPGHPIPAARRVRPAQPNRRRSGFGGDRERDRVLPQLRRRRKSDLPAAQPPPVLGRRPSDPDGPRGAGGGSRTIACRALTIRQASAPGATPAARRSVSGR